MTIASLPKLLCGLPALSLALAACSAPPPPKVPLEPARAVAIPIAPHPPRMRDDEDDAFVRDGAPPTAAATVELELEGVDPPAVPVPAPRPRPPAPPPLPAYAPPADGTPTCTVRLNSIPSSTVILDGASAGRTPQMRIVVSSSTRHLVTFISDDMQRKKSVGFECRAGETKTVVAKLEP